MFCPGVQIVSAAAADAAAAAPPSDSCLERTDWGHANTTQVSSPWASVDAPVEEQVRSQMPPGESDGEAAEAATAAAEEFDAPFILSQQGRKVRTPNIYGSWT